ncbi:hypothetical protein [Belnapia rosea]|uniref:hypothetical protein n=1 Tax=Belnapia rosea TaxID=938405 RepID=UPI00115FB0CF|nr:hypothetical protein [Belnapia rosea]
MPLGRKRPSGVPPGEIGDVDEVLKRGRRLHCLGWCETWRIMVRLGRGTALRVESNPEDPAYFALRFLAPSRDNHIMCNLDGIDK